MPDVTAGLRSFDTSSVERASFAQLAVVDDEQLVLSHQEVSDVIGFIPRLGQVTFDAWGAWPAGTSLGVAVPVFQAGIFGYQLGRGPGDDYALLAGVDLPIGNQVVAWQGAAKQAAYPDPKIFPANDPAPLFVTGRGTSRLYGYSLRPASGVAMLQLATWEALPTGPLPMACATDHLHAAAVLVAGSEYLVATSNGRPFDTCFDDDGSDGPARRLQLARVTADTNLIAYTLAWQDPGDDIVMLQVEMEPFDDGAWLVWQRGGGEQPAPVMGLRVNHDGEPIVGPLPLIDEGIVDGGIATATLQGRLLVAHLDASDPSNSGLLIHAFEPNGSEHDSVYYRPPDELWLLPPVALVGAPSGAQLMLAFSAFGSAPSIEGNASIYVERFSCD